MTRFHSYRSRIRPLCLALSLLTVLTLAACSSTKAPERPSILPPPTFKVNPGLMGEEVPPELQRTLPGRQRPLTDSGEPVVPAGEAGTAGQAAPDKAASDASPHADKPDSLYFDFDRATIKPEFASLLAAHAEKLKANPALHVRIEGHADERGNPAYNKKLGLQRAQAVKEHLVGLGVQSGQLRTLTHGDTHPRKTGEHESSWAENRRADLVYQTP